MGNAYLCLNIVSYCPSSHFLVLKMELGRRYLEVGKKSMCVCGGGGGVHLNQMQVTVELTLAVGSG